MLIHGMIPKKVASIMQLKVHNFHTQLKAQNQQYIKGCDARSNNHKKEVNKVS